MVNQHVYTCLLTTFILGQSQVLVSWFGLANFKIFKSFGPSPQGWISKNVAVKMQPKKNDSFHQYPSSLRLMLQWFALLHFFLARGAGCHLELNPQTPSRTCRFTPWSCCIIEKWLFLLLVVKKMKIIV